MKMDLLKLLNYKRDLITLLTLKPLKQNQEDRFAAYENLWAHFEQVTDLYFAVENGEVDVRVDGKRLV